LRYRIKRATNLVPADLDDPVARMEIHLRLLALNPAL
jgi:DNA-binding PucR family transcriptional regulator